MIPPRWVHFKKVEKVEGTFKGTGTRTVSRLVLLPCTYMHRVEGTKVLYCTLYYYIKIYCFLLRSEYYITSCTLCYPHSDSVPGTRTTEVQLLRHITDTSHVHTKSISF